MSNTLNERVSQLAPLAPTDVASDDLLFIGDSSAHESKKLTAGDLLVYVGLSASFIATHANNADTASYILGSGVSGAVISSSFATVAGSSSIAQRSYNSDTASFAFNTVATAVGSASWASQSLSSSLAASASYIRNALTSSFLLFTGVSNGTASNARTASLAYTASFTVSSSATVSASWANTASVAITAATASFVASVNNGILSYGMAVSAQPQFGVGATVNNPADINLLSSSITVHSVNSKFLVTITVQGGSENPYFGITGAGLWRSGSVGGTPSDVPLLRCISGMLNNEAGNFDNLYSISATYIDVPNLDPGTQVIYRGRAFNNFGTWFVNRSAGSYIFGTSSLTVIEFGA